MLVKHTENYTLVHAIYTGNHSVGMFIADDGNGRRFLRVTNSQNGTTANFPVEAVEFWLKHMKQPFDVVSANEPSEDVTNDTQETKEEKYPRLYDPERHIQGAKIHLDHNCDWI